MTSRAAYKPADRQKVGIWMPNSMVYGLGKIQRRDLLMRADLVRKIIAEYLQRVDREERADV